MIADRTHRRKLSQFSRYPAFVPQGSLGKPRAAVCVSPVLMHKCQDFWSLRRSYGLQVKAGRPRNSRGRLENGRTRPQGALPHREGKKSLRSLRLSLSLQCHKAISETSRAVKTERSFIHQKRSTIATGVEPARANPYDVVSRKIQVIPINHSGTLSKFK